MYILIFPSKILAKMCALYMAKYCKLGDKIKPEVLLCEEHKEDLILLE